MRLEQLTKQEFRKQLSIAGDPDKIMELSDEIWELVCKIDHKNPAELANMEFSLYRMAAELRRELKQLGRTKGQHYTPYVNRKVIKETPRETFKGST